jgi:hypothetical protein
MEKIPWSGRYINAQILDFAGAHQVANDAQKHIQVNMTLLFLQSMSGFHALLHVKSSDTFNIVTAML